MRVPEPLRNADSDGVTVRTYDYEDGGVLAVDFGSAGENASIDVVGGTVIVVTDDDQFEFELPAEAGDVSMNNGVLTITE